MKHLILFIIIITAKTGVCQLDFNKWVKKGKTDKYILPMLGNSTWTNKEKKFIQRTLTKFKNSKSEASNHYLELGSEDFMINMNLEFAMQNFNKSWLLDSTNSDVYYFFGRIYLTFFISNDLAKKEGLSLLNTGLRLNPKNSSILLLKGQIYADEFRDNRTQSEKLDMAIKLLSQSYESSPNHANSYELARCYYLKNDCLNTTKFINETIKHGGKSYVENLSRQLESLCSGK
jgi:tetratricopeptide (TPR) repeat protein